MALTSTITYCENTDLFDVFPDFGKYNNRVKVTGWSLAVSNIVDTLDMYVADSPGLVTDLFFDRAKCLNLGFPSSSVTTTSTSLDEDATTVDLTSTSKIGANDIIKIEDEYMRVSNVLGSTVTFIRGVCKTTAIAHVSGVSVSVVYDASADVTDESSLSENPAFIYDAALDKALLITDNLNPADYDVHAGIDFQTYTTNVRKRASRMIESLLDHRMTREIMKDREGNYPTFIVRATSLQAILLMIKANDPTSELIPIFQSELDVIILGLREGTLTLPNQVTRDSSKGVLREVNVSSSSDLRPVELRGHYGGRDYELLKVKIESGEGGLMGTSKYTVYASDGDNLKTDIIVDSEAINGRFQELGVGSLEIRWGGDDVATAVTTDLDEYEIELHGYGIDATNTQMGSIRMTRRFQG
tara:strand:+ start:5938 stop:7179 length:1242 start_codon:yes stop_codon:yes gene_type:complete